MIREVDLVSYLPPFMQSYKEPVAALESENAEFNVVWTAVDRCLRNRFISTADEYGISRFEKMLKIYPTADDNLESRRARVQSKWFNTIPYTWKVLLQKMIILCGDSNFEIKHDFKTGYTLYIDTDLELYGQVEELENIINTMIPENIVVISKNSIPCIAKGAVLFGGGICFTNMFEMTNDFKEIYSVQGTAVLGGGAVQTEMVQATDSFNELYDIHGAAAIGAGIVHTETIQATDAYKENQTVHGSLKFGGGMVDTTMLQITQDFNETIRADGDANIASGTVHVDFVEIK